MQGDDLEVSEPTPARLARRPWHIRLRDLMPFRVHEILLVSSDYDAFILDEDGPLTERLFTQYRELNLSSAPRLTHAASGRRAMRMLESRRFDLVLVMPRLVGTDAASLARMVKKKHPDLPVVLLMFSEADLAHLPDGLDNEAIDHAFLWTGDARILVAISKLIEDGRNIEHDAEVAGVPVILVVEDSIRYYSTFLTALYAELTQQAHSLVADGVNRLHRLYQMRSRPKVLHARTYEQAEEMFERLKPHVVAVITDIRFPRNGKLDPAAGLDLTRRIRKDRPSIPILLQSAEEGIRAEAHALGASWLNKRSPSLIRKLKNFVSDGLGFGPFVFRRPDQTEVARAHDLYEMAELLERMPPESLTYHATLHHFSVWFGARSLLDVARVVRATEYIDPEITRRFLLDTIKQVALEEREGTISDFGAPGFQPVSAVVRVGGGSVGGKARGIAFANSLLVEKDLLDRFPGLRLRIPKTAVIGTAEFDRFLEANDISEDLDRLEGDDAVQRRFLASRFSDDVKQELHQLFRTMRGPLAVRSSGLLEDLQFQPFSGIYATYMLPNNHPDPDTRFRQFLQAIKAVYASTYSTNARAYVENTPFRQEEKRMAVVVQQMVGVEKNGRFYPHFSGVALSYNYYPIAGQKPREGTVLLALGLGHLIVAGGTVLRFCPKSPGVLPQFASAKDHLKFSQRRFYALDMSRPLVDFTAGPQSSLGLFDLSAAEQDGVLHLVGSVYSAADDVIRDNFRHAGPRVVTFNNILKWTAIPFAEAVSELLRVISRGMGCAVEIELAVDMGDYGRAARAGEAARVPTLYVLQVRPLATQATGQEIEGIDPESPEVIAWTKRALGQGVLHDVRDVVYVKPNALDSFASPEIAAQVGELNARLSKQERPYLLIGPGRWGTSDQRLGVPVEWHQIAGARVIAETPLDGREVEPSQGTHFFQNMTSLGIGYLTLQSTSRNEQGKAFVDLGFLDTQPAASELPAVRHVQFDHPLRILLDGKRSTAMVLKPALPEDPTALPDEPGSGI